MSTSQLKGWKTRRANRLLQVRLRWLLAIAVIVFGSSLAYNISKAHEGVFIPTWDINAYYRAKLTSGDTLKGQVYDLAIEKGMKYGDIERLFKIANCESRFNPEATGVNLHPQSDGRMLTTVDRGLFQINDYYHAEVSNACAYDALCNANEAINIAQRNGGFNAWSCNKLIK